MADRTLLQCCCGNVAAVYTKLFTTEHATMEAFLKAALSSGDEPTKCHICQAESVEDCMLLQRRKQREEEAKEAFIKASAAAAAAGDADESKTSSAAVSVPGKWDMLWDESAHAIFAKHRRLADLPFPDTLITVLDTDTVEAGLETLVEHHLSSVPVINSAGAAVGFLDVADLCTVVLRAYENAGAATGDVFANLRTLLMHAKLISTPIHEVMGISGNDPFLALEDRSPLLQVRFRGAMWDGQHTHTRACTLTHGMWMACRRLCAFLATRLRPRSATLPSTSTDSPLWMRRLVHLPKLCHSQPSCDT